MYIWGLLLLLLLLCVCSRARACVCVCVYMLHLMTVSMFTWNLHILYNSQHVLYPTAVTVSGLLECK
jgi:hypothetical protein